MKRVITAVFLTAFALYAVFWAPQWIFIAITVLVACLCYHEFMSIASASGVEGPLYAGYVAGFVAMQRLDTIPLLAVALMTMAMLSRDLTKALAFSGVTVLGALYAFLPWRWAVQLRAISVWWLFFALSVNWVGDIAAYYAGRAVGRHKLAPRISPGKSWEGAAASMLAALGYGAWLIPRVDPAFSVPEAIAVSVLANIAGQLGDLAESAIKRGAGVKDSGSLLPGHGGFLDRVDSSLFSLPVVYYFLIGAGGSISK